MGAFTNKNTQEQFIEKAKQNGWIIKAEDENKLKSFYDMSSKIGDEADHILEEIMNTAVEAKDKRKEKIQAFEDEFNIIINRDSFDKNFKISEKEFVEKCRMLAWGYKKDDADDIIALRAIYNAARDSGDKNLLDILNEIIETDVGNLDKREKFATKIYRAQNMALRYGDLKGDSRQGILDNIELQRFKCKLREKEINFLVSLRDKYKSGDKISADAEVYINQIMPQMIDKGWKDYDEKAFCRVLAAALDSGREQLDYTYAAKLAEKSEVK